MSETNGLSITPEMINKMLAELQFKSPSSYQQPYERRQNLVMFGDGGGSEPERVDIGTGKIKSISPDGDVEVEFLL